MTPEEYVEEVLALVERIPPGRVMSYGAIADALAERSGRNSARLVDTIMAKHGGSVPWHRVVTSAGTFPRRHLRLATALHRKEGTPLRGDRVDMPSAAWSPGQSSRPPPPRRGSPAAPPGPTAVTPPK